VSLSTIFQLYRDGLFYCRRKPEKTEHQVKTITFDVGNQGPGLGQTRTCCRINIYMQPVTYIYAMMKSFHPHVPQNPQTRFTTTYSVNVYHHESCEVESSSWRGVLDTTLCDEVFQWLAAGRWFCPSTHKQQIQIAIISQNHFFGFKINICNPNTVHLNIGCILSNCMAKTYAYWTFRGRLWRLTPLYVNPATCSCLS
jgi:hypothetical protein